jgi:hypothetical protein
VHPDDFGAIATAFALEFLLRCLFCFILLIDSVANDFLLDLDKFVSCLANSF